MNRCKLLKAASLAVGAMDALTGLLLVLAPGLVLAMLGISAVEGAALVFLRWIGVFVGGVGLSYGMCLRGREPAETVWAFTGVVRLLVCVFVSTQVAAGSLDVRWLVVAVADGVVAAGQFAGLRAGWWKGGAG